MRTGKFEGEKVVGHTGGDQTSHAVMQFYPEKDVSIVVFVNTDNTPTDAISIIGQVALAVLEKEEPSLEEMEVHHEDLSGFVGDYLAINSFYHSSGAVSIEQYENDPSLYRKGSNSDSKGQKLYYLGNHEFAYKPYTMDRVIFQTDNQGQVLAFTNYWNGLQKSGLFIKQN